jgi:hypothetical protein
MADNYILLERTELNTDAASVTFSNIPQSGYTDLKIVTSARGTASLSSGYVDGIITFNGSTTGYSERMVYGIGSSAGSLSQSSTGIKWNFATSSVATASTFGNSEAYIPNYTSSNNKSVSIDTVAENNSSTVNILALNAGLWSNTAAITSITITAGSGSFVANSTFSLYGIAALGTTPVIAPKAIGGNRIDNDGTFWYHTFTSSGTFTPLQGITASLLVIGGGGGGGHYVGGGGGAGGYQVFTSQALTATNYSCTIGAGGAGGTSAGAGTDGASTTFTGLSASIGGGGGGTYNTAGRNGASGGGGTAATGFTAGGTGTQGFNGGNAGGVSNNYPAGGGGGAGAAGQNGISDTTGGAGGAGKNSESAWASVTGTGVSGFYGGGGGGGVYQQIAGSAGAGGSGGGGAAGAIGGNNVGAAGVVNTGSGGGGASGTSASPKADGGAGGSGIIIIRYPIAS